MSASTIEPTQQINMSSINYPGLVLSFGLPKLHATDKLIKSLFSRPHAAARTQNKQRNRYSIVYLFLWDHHNRSGHGSHDCRSLNTHFCTNEREAEIMKRKVLFLGERDFPTQTWSESDFIFFPKKIPRYAETSTCFVCGSASKRKT